MMDKKLLNLTEAFIKMNESLLRMVLALNRAKFAVENLLRVKYKAAGYPFGDTEEGLLQWRDYLSEKYELQSRKTAPAEFAENQSGIADLPDYLFARLNDEIKKRLN